MKIFRIIKTIRAKNITDALKKESSAEVEKIDLIEEEENESKIGY